MSEERRRHARVSTAALPCVLRDAEGQETGFELIDLSESGARLRCDRALPAMTRVGVALRLPGAEGEETAISDDAEAEGTPIETVGVVVWSHRVGEGSFDTGVFFPELEADGRARLQAYVAATA